MATKMIMYNMAVNSKGQLISEANFEVFIVVKVKIQLDKVEKI